MRRRAWWVILAAVGLPFTAQAQERAVSGTVKNAVSGVAVRGAEISEVGGRASARSDATGRFTILVPAGALRLQARAIGYHRAEVAVSASDTSVAFALTEDVFQLEAVVVSGQATGIERRFATTAATIVQGQDLNNVPAQTVDKALQGKVPGAYIMQNSGAPGGGMQIQIRGTNTIIGSPDPVFVVDGVLYSNASLPSGLSTVTASGSNQGSGQLQDDPVNRLADLNPADIASIQVLRGAAASSIYGSKAANGVVIITTNRGRAGKAEFSITQRFGVSSLLRGPATRSFTEAEALNYYGAASAADTAYIKSFEVNGVLPTYDHLHDVAGQKPLAVETDLTVSGGSQNTRYFLSGSEKQDNGIEPNTGAGRQSLRANIDQTFSDRLSMQFSSAFSRTTTDRGFTNNDNSGASVTYAIAYIPGFIPITPDAKGNFPQPAITYLGSNPLQSATLGTNHEMAVRFVGGSTLTYQAVANDRTNFRIVAAGGLDIFSQRDNVVAPADLYFQQRLTYPGTATISNATSLQWNWNLNAIHAYTAANQSFRATTSVGIQVEDRQLDRDRVTGQGLLPGQIHVDQAAILGNQLQRTEVDRTLAFYGQEEWLGLDQRLNLTAGVRAERNSSNGNTKQYFLYPKLSASYRVVAGEGSEVKLRSAFGETGNHPQFGQKFTTLGTAVIGGNVGTTVGGTAGAPAIKPEQVREIEGGVDATFLHSRASVEVTGYVRHTYNLLLSRTPAPSSGFGAQIINSGTLMNKGLEIGAGIIPVQNPAFSWNVRTTFTMVRNRVDALPVLGFRPSNAGYGLAYGEFFVEVGKPITQIIGTDTLPGTGGTTYVRSLGQANPDFRLSLNNELTWKRVSVSMLWDWQHGGVAQNQTLSLYDCNGLASDQGTPTGQARYDACNVWGIAVPFVQSTSFLKLREVSLAWNLPESALSMFPGAHSATISITGRNLLLFTKYFGYDPEVSNYGTQAVVRNIDLGPYPPSRQFFFSITAGF